jgi:hypothetical protein
VKNKILTLVCTLLVLSALSGFSQAQEPCETWGQRIPVNTSTVYGSLSEYQMEISINTTELYESGLIDANCVQSEWSDDSANFIPYWFDTCDTSGGNTTYYVRVPTVSDNVYFCFNNTAQTVSTANATATFDLYDDFNQTDGTPPNIDIWDNQTSNGVCEFYVQNEELYINQSHTVNSGCWLNQQNSSLTGRDYGFRLILDTKLTTATGSNIYAWGFYNQSHEDLAVYASKRPAFRMQYDNSNDNWALFAWYNGGSDANASGANPSDGYSFRIDLYVNQTNTYGTNIYNITEGNNSIAFAPRNEGAPSALWDNMNGDWNVHVGFQDPGSGGGVNMTYDNVIKMKYIEPNPTYTLNSPEVPPISTVGIQIDDPQNTTYTNADTIDVNIALNDTDNITTYLNGVLQNTYSSVTQVNDTITPLETGTYNFTAVGTDDTQEVWFTVSNASLIITVENPTTSYTNEQEILVNLTLNYNSDVDTYLDGILQNNYVGVVDVDDTLGYLETGTYNFTTYATDIYDNFNSTEVTITVINGTAPTVTITYPTGSVSGIPLPLLVPLNVTTSEPVTDCQSDITGSYASMNSINASYWWDERSLALGSYTWNVRCDDSFGNRGTDNIVFSVSQTSTMRLYPVATIIPIALITGLIVSLIALYYLKGVELNNLFVGILLVIIVIILSGLLFLL